MNDIERIRLLESELASLPKEYISIKKIQGKTRYYLQWNENGKKKSRYLKDSEISSWKEKMEQKKHIKEELKKLKASLSAGAGKPNFRTNVYIKDELNEFLSVLKPYQKRNQFESIQNYLYQKTTNKVCILFGLRRTGKTTLILQSIEAMDEETRKKAAYIIIQERNTIDDIDHDLSLLKECGYKYVFIDEVTASKDFIECASLFSDVYVLRGMRIVLSGTDSLSFPLASNDSLYDRAILLHTTYIPYHEFERLMNIKNIDEFIQYGGTLCNSIDEYGYYSPFMNKEKTKEYINSSICLNIQHSLKNYDYGNHFRSLYDLYQKDELTNAINRVVEDINHRFTVDVITKDFVSSDYSISEKNLRKDKTYPDITLSLMDKESIKNRLMEFLNIINQNRQQIKITDDNVSQIKEYLKRLDLIDEIEIYSFDSAVTNKTVITQPGLRYAQATALIESIFKDELFVSLSKEHQQNIIQRILSDIQGRMMEEIVLFETKKHWSDKKEVFKLQFDICEFDMVIYDKESNTCQIFEIKHSKEAVKEQYKNLIDEEKCKKTIAKYGLITDKYVIYRGEEKTKDNIQFINIENYLRQLKIA